MCSHLLSTKLLDFEWGDDDTGTNPPTGNAVAARGSPMKVEHIQREASTVFGVNTEEFNKLTDINKLRRCWTYHTSKSCLI